MLTARQVFASAAALVVSAVLSPAQNIAPAHSGTVHYFEGDVTVDGTKLVSQVARFTDLKEQSVLHTGLGRAEILLTPGVLLRVGENSSVKMLDNRLISTRIELLEGTAMLESDDAGSSVKDPAVTIIYKDFQAQPLRSGIFEVSSQPGRLRVFKGEARVAGNGATLTVKDGNLVDLTMTMAKSSFDAKQGDDLYLWSRDRSAYLSAANMSSARTLAGSGGYGYNTLGYGSGFPNAGWNPAMWNGFSGGWYYNSLLNMYSYLPFSGTIYSPFGFGYYNPATIGEAYVPTYYWSGSGGARTGTTTGVPLTSLSPGTGGVKPSLPRLGVTATLRPTLSTATPGSLAGFRLATAPLSARDPFAGSPVASSSVSSSSAPLSAMAPSAAAPISAGASAASAAAAAPHVGAVRR